MYDTVTLDRIESDSADSAIARLVQYELIPRVTAIDLDGEYLETFPRRLGGFAGVVAPEYGGSGRGLVNTITTMAQVSKTCLSTAFTVWCQTACARYIQLSDNVAVKIEFLPGLASRRQLGGTGLSNTLKSSSEIERFLLTARRVQGGYEIIWCTPLGIQLRRRPHFRHRLPGC